MAVDQRAGPGSGRCTKDGGNLTGAGYAPAGVRYLHWPVNGAGGSVGEDFRAVSGGLTAGSRLAGYLLEEQIGQGGMAVVFRALDTRLKRQVALKILAPALAADEAFRQRFMRESQAAAAVDDPHIIPVFQAGEASGVLFIAMRLVRGGDVATLLRREGAMRPRR